VIEKYRDFHQKMGLEAGNDRFERFLVATSARGPLWARLADSYAKMWRKSSCVRRKLVLTLGLLECTPPAFEKLDRTPGGGSIGVLFHLGLGVAGYVCALLAASALFGPVHLWMRAGER
jgi:hypothetical protein